jgi:hypothetical protein
VDLPVGWLGKTLKKMVAIPSGSVIVHSMMKNEKLKEALAMVLVLAISAGIGVMLAWRG